MYYKDWLLNWLEHYIKPTTKDKTCTRYKEIVNVHLIPKFGDYDLREPLKISSQY